MNTMFNRVPLPMRIAAAMMGAALWSLSAAELEKADLDRLAGQPVAGKNLRWKRMDVIIEWGFKAGAENAVYDGCLEASFQGQIAKPEPLAGDTGTKMTGPYEWRSRGDGKSRRGVFVPLLYADSSQSSEQTAITLWTKSGSFTFLPADAEAGPILAPEYGFFVVKAGPSTTARDFAKELATQNRKTIRQRVREHPEQNWEQAMRAMFPQEKELCPANPGLMPEGQPLWFETLPPYPEPPFGPAMEVQVPCAHLTAAWRVGAWHILRRCAKDPNGRWVVACYPYPPLALETDEIINALDLMGMHQVARDGLSLWLDHPREDGCLNLGTPVEKAHGSGAGNILWALSEHYALTGDKSWLAEAAPKLKAGAEWIVRQRRKAMEEAKLQGGSALNHPSFGLMPPLPIGDLDDRGVLRYYFTDSVCYQGLKRCGEVLSEIQPEAGSKLLAEAEDYQRDFRAALDNSIARSPVIRVRDGTYHSFIPPAPHTRGSAVRTDPQGHYGHGGPYWADTDCTLAWIDRSGLLAPEDPRLNGHLDVMEDVFLLDNPKVLARTRNYDPDKHWFSHAGWYYQMARDRTPYWYLMQDDVPNFLRSFLNQYAEIVIPGEYTFREHSDHGPFDKSFEEAVFLARFRKMLVMEEGDCLWLARATPRAWLEQGKTISVKSAPTYFGALAYHIRSDVDHGKISATLQMPSRKTPKVVLLRFRHPKAAPLRSVAVDGKPWKDFVKEKEVIRLEGLTGTVTVQASY